MLHSFLQSFRCYQQDFRFQGGKAFGFPSINLRKILTHHEALGRDQILHSLQDARRPNGKIQFLIEVLLSLLLEVWDENVKSGRLDGIVGCVLRSVL